MGYQLPIQAIQAQQYAQRLQGNYSKRIGTQRVQRVTATTSFLKLIEQHDELKQNWYGQSSAASLNRKSTGKEFVRKKRHPHSTANVKNDTKGLSFDRYT